MFLIRKSTVIPILFSIFLLGSFCSPIQAASISLEQVGVVEFGDYLFDIAIEGNYAYIADYGKSLIHSVDISDPENPILVANFSVYLPHYFEVQDGIAYIAAWTAGLQIYNVSNPVNAVKLSEFVGINTGAVGIYEDTVFVGRDDGFNILDVSNPSNPINLSRIIRNGNAHNFFIEETYAYVLNWNHTSLSSNLEVYDYSNPSSPLLVSFYDTTKECYDIKVKDNVVYLAGSHEGLSIVDFSDFSNPTLVGEVDENEQSMALVVVEDTVFLGNGFAGLQLFDVSTKTNPTLLAEYQTDGYAEELEIRNEYVFLTTEGVGLEILKVKGLGLEAASGYNFVPTMIVLLVTTAAFVFRRRKNRR